MPLIKDVLTEHMSRTIMGQSLRDSNEVGGVKITVSKQQVSPRSRGYGGVSVNSSLEAHRGRVSGARTAAGVRRQLLQQSGNRKQIRQAINRIHQI